MRIKLFCPVTSASHALQIARAVKRVGQVHVRCYGQKPSLLLKLWRGVNRRHNVLTLTEENQFDRLAESVTPLYKIPYEEQLQLKHEYVRESLRKLVRIAVNCKPKRLTGLLREQSELHDGQCCPLEDIKPSPSYYGYRNKDELNIGCDIHGNRKTVGLFVGKGKDKQVICVEPHNLINMSAKHIQISKAYQDFIRSSALPSCQMLYDGGNWKQIVVRTTMTGQTMLSVHFHPQGLSQNEIEAAGNELREYFTNGPGKSLDLHSLYFQPCPQVFCSGSQFPYQLLHGSPYIEERVLGMKFRISPDSFFQTNTPAAEVLYSTVREYADLSPESTVFDVYCGTGTIGILLSPSAKRVVGIEVTEQAVEDARVNAQINGCSNVDFIQGDARKLMNEQFGSGEFSGEDLVAVVNPGRIGMSLKGVRALKRCSAIRKLVFVTCKPHGKVLKNVVDLCTEMEDIAEPPFRPVKAVVVDMFPHTLHTELVILFER